MNWDEKMSHTYVGILKMLSRETLDKTQFVAHIKERKV
jgi:hypothetical protein